MAVFYNSADLLGRDVLVLALFTAQNERLRVVHGDVLELAGF